jgi:hypothetical protein
MMHQFLLDGFVGHLFRDMGYFGRTKLVLLHPLASVFVDRPQHRYVVQDFLDSEENATRCLEWILEFDFWI